MDDDDTWTMQIISRRRWEEKNNFGYFSELFSQSLKHKNTTDTLIHNQNKVKLMFFQSTMTFMYCDQRCAIHRTKVSSDCPWHFQRTSTDCSRTIWTESDLEVWNCRICRFQVAMGIWLVDRTFSALHRRCSKSRSCLFCHQQVLRCRVDAWRVVLCRDSDWTRQVSHHHRFVVASNSSTLCRLVGNIPRWGSSQHQPECWRRWHWLCQLSGRCLLCWCYQ